MSKEITISKPTLLLIVFGNLITLGLSAHQYIMFVRAFLDPQKAIVLYIDVFHEANFEMVTLTLSMIIGVISTIYILKFLRGLNQGEVIVKNKK
jgi:hypothetical protein